MRCTISITCGLFGCHPATLTLQGCKKVVRQLSRMVVELINGQPQNERIEGVDILYMYRALDEPQGDVLLSVNNL
jgi:hypothetical protein